MRTPALHKLLEYAVKRSSLSIYRGRVTTGVLARETVRLASKGELPEEAGNAAWIIHEALASLSDAAARHFHIMSVGEWSRLVGDIACFAPSIYDATEYLEHRGMAPVIEARAWATKNL